MRRNACIKSLLYLKTETGDGTRLPGEIKPYKIYLERVKEKQNDRILPFGILARLFYYIIPPDACQGRNLRRFVKKSKFFENSLAIFKKVCYNIRCTGYETVCHTPKSRCTGRFDGCHSFIKNRTIL